MSSGFYRYYNHDLKGPQPLASIFFGEQKKSLIPYRIKLKIHEYRPLLRHKQRTVD